MFKSLEKATFNYSENTWSFILSAVVGIRSLRFINISGILSFRKWHLIGVGRTNYCVICPYYDVTFHSFAL